MLKDRWTNSPNDSQEINAMIENRKEIYHPNLCRCKSYIQQEDKQFFNTFYKHHMAFEYYDNNLDKEIQRRRDDLSGVEREKESQLWYTANSIVDMDCYLAQEGGSYHGDL